MRFHAISLIVLEVTHSVQYFPVSCSFHSSCTAPVWRNRRVLQLPRFYCEEQSLEGIIICSSNIYFTQTFIQSNTQGAEVLATCRLHLELNFTICLLYLKASHQSGMLNRCWCMSRHICGTHCLSLKFRCFHGLWQVQAQQLQTINN